MPQNRLAPHGPWRNRKHIGPRFEDQNSEFGLESERDSICNSPQRYIGHGQSFDMLVGVLGLEAVEVEVVFAVES